MTTRFATAAGAGPDVRFFLPFAKVEEKADGSVYVESIATAEVKDHHGEIVSHEGSVAAFSEWTDWAEKATGGESMGNIREMHDRIGAGKAVKWTVDEAQKSNSLGLLVIDTEAAKKTKARVYTGLSIGGDQVKREIREINGEKVPVITSYRLTEVSLVDKPACPVATFTMVKRLDPKETPMEKATPQLAEGEEIVRTIEAEGKPVGWLIRKKDDKGVPRAELAKDVSTSADAALSAVKQFMVDVLGMPGGTDIWTLDDAMSALRYMWFAATAAQAKESMGGIEMAAKSASPNMSVIVSMGPIATGVDFMTNLHKLVEAKTYEHHAKLEDACKKFLADNNCKPEDCEIVYPSADSNKFLVRKREPITKSDTPADPPAEEEKPVEEETRDKPKDETIDPPAAPATEVPPSQPAASEIENAVKAAIAPLIEKLSVIEKAIGNPIVATLDKVDAPQAVVKADLEKFATAESVTNLAKDVTAIKKAIESLPAPPAGRRIEKSIGEGTSGHAANVEQFGEAIEKAIQAAANAGATKQVLDKMRMDLAQEAFKRT